MPKNIHSHKQVQATKALIKFITDHDGSVDRDLKSCLAALECDDLDSAITHAKMVQPFGMGSLTDWFPPVVFANETKEYAAVVLESLVRNWCHLISLSFPKSREP